MPEEKQDVDREIRLFNLFTLKKQAEDSLAAELAKGTVYTKREAEEKQANLENNYREIRSVNKEETVKDFHAKMKLITTPKDLYYSPLSDLMAMVQIQKEAAAKKFNDEKHTQFVEKMQQEYESKQAKIKAKEAKEKEEAAKQKEEEEKKKEEEEEKRHEAIKEKCQ